MGRFVLFLLGLLVGALGVGAVVYTQAPRAMLSESPSPLGLQETVQRISEAAVKDGWVVQSVIKLEESIEKNGGGKVRPVWLVNLCEAKHAAKMMNVDDARRVSVFMPCTISVYEKSDGKVYVGAMNAGLLGRLFGGVVAEVMGEHVAAAQQRFLDAVGAEAPPR